MSLITALSVSPAIQLSPFSGDGLRLGLPVMRFKAPFLFPQIFRCYRPQALVSARRGGPRLYSAVAEEPELGELLEYMEKLRNYERIGVPEGAGTDSDSGFDLSRMRRLLRRLGDPHFDFKAVHIAGTKGKGSTAAFLSNILREEGFSVGCYTSPHLLTIRERISCGRVGGPIAAELLKNIFHKVKGIIDESIKLERRSLTHFEVFTALAFTLFSQEKVDIAIVEAGLGGARDATNVLCSTSLVATVITTIGEEHLSVLGGSLESIAMAKSGIIKQGCPLVIGGPFKRHIERIIRDRASLMKSSVISACDPEIQSSIKYVGKECENPYQSCEIHITIKDFQLAIDLPNVKLHMLGSHQLQNAVTAICAALCLRNQGYQISDDSIRSGLEGTMLPGRSQILSRKEAVAIGLHQSIILADGAHTEASAKCLGDVIRAIYPDRMLVLIVSMASDKDHLAFAKQLLLGSRPDMVILTEVSIAGGLARTTSASYLKDVWLSCALELGIGVEDIGLMDHEEFHDDNISSASGCKSHLRVCYNTAPIGDSLKVADRFFKSRSGDQSGLIVVTGSLHIVSSLLSVIR